MQRLIQAVVRAKICQNFRRDVSFAAEGAARRETDQEKRDRRNQEQDRDDFEEASKDQDEHGVGKLGASEKNEYEKDNQWRRNEAEI